MAKTKLSGVHPKRWCNSEGMLVLYLRRLPFGQTPGFRRGNMLLSEESRGKNIGKNIEKDIGKTEER
jgi:hypothetical protein